MPQKIPVSTYIQKKRRAMTTHGFTIMEMAVVLVIIGFLFVFAIPVTNTVMSNQKRAATLQNLKNIQTALNNYVTMNKRLPCPADGSLATPTGLEVTRVSGDCPGNQAVGIVPWVPLGLAPADVRDGWFNQITYRVGWGLTRDSALDMTSCDPAGTRPATTGWPAVATGGLCDPSVCIGTFTPANCTSPTNFLASKGLDVTSDGTTKVMDHANFTGAAYILISHGDNGYGAINSAGVYVASAARGVAGTTLENPNRNLATLVVTSAVWNQFVDAPFSDSSDPTAYFDDIIIRPSLLSVMNQAQLGPRSH